MTKDYLVNNLNHVPRLWNNNIMIIVSLPERSYCIIFVFFSNHVTYRVQIEYLYNVHAIKTVPSCFCFALWNRLYKTRTIKRIQIKDTLRTRHDRCSSLKIMSLLISSLIYFRTNCTYDNNVRYLNYHSSA